MFLLLFRLWFSKAKYCHFLSSLYANELKTRYKINISNFDIAIVLHLSYYDCYILLQSISFPCTSIDSAVPDK
jgi:hypothetical protein